MTPAIPEGRCDRGFCAAGGILLAAAVLARAAGAETEAGLAEGGAPSAGAPSAMRLWKTVDLRELPGTFPCPGDLDGDGRVDFLLYREGPQTTPGYLVAVTGEGKKLWELGDPSVAAHAPDGIWDEPALRGAALVFDFDGDGRAEAVTELWRDGLPHLVLIDGATGAVERSRPSPLDLEVRGGKRSRCHPAARIAWLRGRDAPPALVLKFEASDFVPFHVFALDSRLEVLWHATGGTRDAGHLPTAADVDGDGRDEIALGATLLDPEGRVLWQKEFLRHADCTAIADVHAEPGREVFASVCGTGPAFCFSAKGGVIWEKTREEVPHGQGIWVGDFIEEEPGSEAVILRSGHVGDFLTVRARDGKELAAFRHRKEFRGYPDFPHVVRWLGRSADALWIPIDRAVVDGRGRAVAELGPHEATVADLLRPGTTKEELAVQAIPLDLCGDEREELILYQPYRGRAILIFTQGDSDGREKPYRHAPSAYNLHTYF